MAFEQDEFKFPDEQDEVSNEIEIEIEDDTPEEDRGRQPMPKEIVNDLENDELDNYDEGVKQKLKQLKKVWHDERRAKEQAFREQEEAVTLARQLFEENKRIKATLQTGEKEYASTIQDAAALEVAAAKRELKEAYDSGDSDALVEAQAKLNNAQLREIRAKNFKPSLQEDEYDVQQVQERLQPRQQIAQPDYKALAWKEKNPWFGQDPEMTSSALGLHQKLMSEGVAVGSDEYYATLDKTMRKRFSEYFGESEERATPKAKPTVVAPAKRSTSSNRITLKQSEIQIAKRLGLTPEQYALSKRQLENK